MLASELVDVLKEVQSVTEENDHGTWSDFVDEDFYEYDRDETSFASELKKRGIVIDMEDHYGGEGQGDDYWHVFSVTKDGEISYFQLSGSYASHYGHEFYDYFDFVQVAKVPVQRYEWQTV